MSHRSKGPSQRQLKAGEVIRRALVDILAREEFRDPDLQGVSVTISEVRASPDLKRARIYAAPLGHQTAERTALVIAALNRASRFIRGRLGREIAMKSTPSLHFFADDTFDTASDLEALLARPDVARDLKPIDSES